MWNPFHWILFFWFRWIQSFCLLQNPQTYSRLAYQGIPFIPANIKKEPLLPECFS